MASWACPATSKTARIIVRIRNRFFIFSPCQNNLDFGPLELQELVLKCSANFAAERPVERIIHPPVAPT